MKVGSIREMGQDDLKGKEHELEEQLFRLRLQQSLGQLDNPLKIREVRRDIARVKTILKEKAAPARA
jgi:large subunit ribosomal protein L29